MTRLDHGHGQDHAYVTSGEDSPYTKPTVLDTGHGVAHAYVTKEGGHDGRTAGKGKPRRDAPDLARRADPADQGSSRDVAPDSGGDADGGGARGTLRALSEHPKVARDLKKLPRKIQQTYHERVDGLRRGEAHPSTHALTGPLKGWQGTNLDFLNRVVHRSDGDQLHVLSVGNHDEAYDSGIRRNAASGTVYSHFAEDNRDIFDAHQDGKNVGYVTTDRKPDHVWLDEVYVHPAARGRGIARQLMQNALEHHQGQEVRLKPDPYGEGGGAPEEALRQFYRSHGFENDGSHMVRTARFEHDLDRCQSCFGRGEFSDGSECDDCDGSGRRECPCGQQVAYDPQDGFQHLDGSISHYGDLARYSVSDLMDMGRLPKRIDGTTRTAGLSDELEFRERDVSGSLSGARALEAHHAEHGKVGEIIWQHDPHTISMGEGKPRKELYPKGMVRNVVVEPEHKRRGIGTALWNRAKELTPWIAHSDNQSEEGRAWAARTASIRMVPPEEFKNFSFPDYPQAKTPDALVKHFQKTSPEYYNKIKDDVQKNGFSTPVLVRWHDPRGKPLKKPQLMTGHHRAAVAHELGIPLPVGDHASQEDFDTAFQGERAWFAENQRPTHDMPHEGRYTAPTKRLFGPTFGLDTRIWDGEKLRESIRDDIIGRFDAFCARHGYSNWRRWAKLVFFGSEASEWTSKSLHGNNDFDLSLGIHYPVLRVSVPHFGPAVSDTEISDTFTQQMHAELNDPQHRFPGVDGIYDQTWYANHLGWDITQIRPYAAYDVVANDWIVKPPHLEDWSLKRFPEGEGLAEQVHGIILMAEGILAMPEPYRTQNGAALWHFVHDNRSDAFGEDGEGWWDARNVIEKALDQKGLMQRLWALMDRAKQDPSTLRAPAGWSNDPGSGGG